MAQTVFISCVSVLLTASYSIVSIKADDGCNFNISNTIKVNKRTCQNSLSLSFGDSSCQANRSIFCSLEEALHCLVNSTQIIIEDNKTEVTNSTAIYYKDSIAIRGAPSGTSVTCTHNGVALSFVFITKLCFRDIVVHRCGGQHHIAHTTVDINKYYGALSVLESYNIYIHNVHIHESIGAGLYLANVYGIAEITNTTFSNNPRPRVPMPSNIPKCARYGGGVYVESKRSNLSIIFDNCNFINNSIIHNKSKKFDPKHTNHGGGLYINIKLAYSTFMIKQCMFEDNTGGYGGGMVLYFKKNACHSNASIADSQFIRNKAKGTFAQIGGGLLIGFSQPENGRLCSLSDNHIYLDNITFKENTGWIGGGLACTASRQLPNSMRNEIIIRNSNWLNNKARSGAAVSFLRYLWDKAGRGSLPAVTIHNCTFQENYNQNLDVTNKYFLKGWVGPGVFFVIYIDITFTGITVFERNNGSAIGSVDSILSFKSTNITFSHNNGWDGGAISLRGLSYIALHKHSIIHFNDNRAFGHGGAVFAQLVIEETILSAITCPFQSSQRNISPDNWNVSLNFTNNKADQNGQSIFVTSLLPCQIAYGYNISELLNASDVFNNSNTFTFLPHIKTHVATSASLMKLTNNHNLSSFPGENFLLPIILQDDLGNSVTNITLMIQTKRKGKQQSTISINQVLHASGVNITLKGEPGEQLYLNVTSMKNPHISMDIVVPIKDCPPAFMYVNDTSTCDCPDKIYYGLTNCHQRDFKISVRRGIYIESQNSKIVTTRCPDWFCSYVNKEEQPSYNLPSFIDYKDNYTKELEKFICNNHRHGTLCGLCNNGYTVYYNSPTFKCKKETKLCDIGWLFYVLSSLIPLTLMFVIITVFEINLTIGSLRGFLLFSQIIVILDINPTEFKSASQITKTVASIWRIVYDVFSLKFLYIDELSFCLIRGATVLDMLVVQYVATIYALLLIIVVLFSLRYCTLNYNRFCSCIRFTTIKYSFVNSLSALLILCYGNSAVISLQILNTAVFYGQKEKVVGSTRVYLQGNLIYFSAEHLPYALPATVCFFTVVLIPLVLFLICPLVNKVFDIFKLGDKPIGMTVSRCYLGGKLKPFYDIFQGCFKEKCYLFAGLYFLYHIIVLSSYLYSETAGQNFLSTELTLVAILTIHSLAQPYRNRSHNIIDTLLFTDLVFINSLSYYIYLGKLYPDMYLYVTAAYVIQNLLIFLPFSIFAFYIVNSYCKRQSFYATVNRKISANKNKRKMTRSRTKVDACDSLYGTIDYVEEDQKNSEFDESEDDASFRKRQISMSSFIAHEQLVLIETN